MQTKNKDTEKEKSINKIDRININCQTSKYTQKISSIPVYSPYPLYEGQKMFIEYIIQCLTKKMNGLIQSPTGTGKTLSLLCSTISWVYHEQQQGKQPIRIIYTSRTHAQLKQIIQELQKTGFDLKISILGSRDHACINDDLKQLSGQSKELECRLRVMKRNGLFCKYFHHEDFYSKMQSIGRIADLEQIKYIGKTQGYCPFFYEKHCKNRANLILMPYTYILDEKASQNEDLTSLVQNSIVIFDQAHNIPSICQNSKQFSINLSTLSRALHYISDLREQRLQLQRKVSSKKQDSDEVEQKLIKTTIPELEQHASYISLIHTHMQTLHIPLEQGLVLNANDFLQSLDNGTEDGEFGKIKNKIKQLVNSAVTINSDILLKPYWALEAWLAFLSRVQEIYRLSSSNEKAGFFRAQICYYGSDIKINMLCLDPKISFQRLSNLKPHSIILTSGTLSPMNSIPLQLQTQFNKPLACPHIMSKQQVNGCIITMGPNKVKLNFSYENRENVQLYKQLGSVLLEIVTKTPNGVIVFVPSYNVLEKIKLELTNCGIMTKIYTKKNVYFEKSNSNDFKIVLQKYLQDASKEKGALLFALARGKISEGLDFSDEKCRAVVLIGVPYPAAKDLKVMLKMEYLDIKNKQTKSMNGNQWYICETIRCINQSIGRIVRNKSDYGSIFLIDERFKKNQVLSQISTWARQCLKVVDDFEELQSHLQVFQEYFKKKNSQSEQVQLFFTSHLGTKLTNKVNTNMKSLKASISMPRSQYQNKVVKPQDELQLLKAELKNQKKSEEPQKMQGHPSLQKLVFGARKKKSLPENSIKECPICRQQRRLIKNTECIHEICEQCWDIWLKKDLRCPICRVRVREKYLIKQ